MSERKKVEDAIPKMAAAQEAEIAQSKKAIAKTELDTGQISKEFYLRLIEGAEE